MIRLLTILFSISATFVLYSSCDEVKNTSEPKDLGRHMMDLKIYQENLGDEIAAGRFDYASWLLEGMDSVFHIVSKEFKEHRMLKEPFSRYYDAALHEPVNSMKDAIRKKDKQLALKSYRTLVFKCDGCHVDNNVDEIVRY